MQLCEACIVSGGDAEQFVNFLRVRETEGDYVHYELDSEMRLQRAFWMTPKQIELYHCYYDVVIQDNTYRCNKYDFPLCFIAIVDCNFHTRVVASAIIFDEKISSFNYIFEHVMKAAGAIAPICIYTDADSAASASIASVFPHTRHFRCLWHLAKDITRWFSRLGSREKRSDFMKDFFLVRRSPTVSQFQVGWDKLCNKWNMAHDSLPSYLSLLYADAHRWALAYQLDIFTAGISATQRVEGMFGNNFTNMLHRNSRLTDLYFAVSSLVGQQLARSIEKQADHLVFTSVNTGDNLHIACPSLNDVLKRAFGPILEEVLKYGSG